MHGYVQIPLFAFVLIQVYAVIRLFQYGEKLELSGMKDSKGLLDDLHNNLELAPITEVQFAASCPAGFEEEVIGEWPGISAGCYCPNARSKYKTAVCTDMDKTAGCQDISRIPLILYNVWKGVKVCSKRMDDGTYDKMLAQCSSGSSCCKDGFKRCGEDLCVSNSAKCPITSISSASKGNKSETVTLGNQTFAVIRGTTNTSRQIVAFQVTRAPLPCLDPNVQDKGEHDSYPFLNSNHMQVSCGRWGFNTLYSQTIDSMTEPEFLKQNSIYPTPTVSNTTAPAYNTYIADSDVFLASRSQIKVEVGGNCINFSPSFIDEFNQDLDNLRKTVVKVEIVHCILLGLGIVFTVAFYSSVWLQIKIKEVVEHVILRWGWLKRPWLRFVFYGIIASLFLLLLMGWTLHRYYSCKEYIEKATLSQQNLGFFVDESCIGDFRYNEALGTIDSGNVYAKINYLNGTIVILTWSMGLLIVLLGVVSSIQYYANDPEAFKRENSGLIDNQATRTGGIF